MSADTSPHPSADELAAFDAGCLPAERNAAVETHVAACESCCRRLEGLPEDAFAALVRAYAGKGDGGRTRPLPSDQGAAWEVPDALVGHARYRVLGLLGQGGMGVVYKAVQQHMDRVVALKVIHKPLLACPDFVERFRREVKAVARLRHPNIALAHDADQSGDLHFLVMEYVEGTSLDRVVARRGPLPVAEACEFVRQAALGLQHAHEQGLVHRDVKPHNLLLTPQGQVKVVDFGLAHLPRAEGAAATPVTSAPLLGTPDYTAPEQARDPSGVDVRADVYSLGCTLYFLLTAQVPFPGGTPLQKLLSHQERPPRPVTELRREVPAALAAVLGRMLAKDRARRPATPGEVASALAPFAAAAPQETVPLPAPRLSASRRWGLRLGALALLTVLAAAGLAAWWRGWPKGEAKDGPPAHVEPPPPALAAAPPGLLGTEEITRLKRGTRDRVVDWVRANAASPKILSDTARDVDKALAKFDGYQLTFGSRLLRSRKPAVLAARLGDLFLFELTPADEPALELPPNRRSTIRFQKGDEPRRDRPRVLLSGLHIDHADRLPRDQRVTGRVTFQALQPVGPDPHLRMVYYPSSGGAGRCIGMFYPRGGLPAAGGELRFDMPEPKEKYAPEDRLLVFFVELASLRDGEPVVESNTVAALVRPVRPAPRKRGP
jgi:predicted Ser/Thr protein kinase